MKALRNAKHNKAVNKERIEGNNAGAEQIRIAKKRKRDKKMNDDNTDKQNQPKQRQRIDTEIQVLGSIIRDADLRTLDDGNDANDVCMNTLLKMIANEAGPGVYAVTSYFYTAIAAEGWPETKRYFYSTDIGNQWASRSSIPITADVLIIPIHTGGTAIDRHWSAVLRRRALHMDRYDFFYFDSLNSLDRAKKGTQITQQHGAM